MYICPRYVYTCSNCDRRKAMIRESLVVTLEAVTPVVVDGKGVQNEES